MSATIPNSRSPARIGAYRMQCNAMQCNAMQWSRSRSIWRPEKENPIDMMSGSDTDTCATRNAIRTCPLPTH
jgi:hypothetical protein